ncbi:MAG TPA: rhodanese-like domain-containing protein [Thermoanaerobaculia bacterium]|nr:rhodanese-like domain-containing protein [Thermoanaerobaculia bacterium]
MSTPVSEFPAATPAETLARFQDRFRFETDCADVHAGLEARPDFVLVDARSAGAFEKGHVPGAVNIPHRTITAQTMGGYPPSTLFVVYCDGPHCNGAARAAVRLASLNYRVKEMVGGITGWLDEGFALEQGAAAAQPIAASRVACGC